MQAKLLAVHQELQKRAGYSGMKGLDKARKGMMVELIATPTHQRCRSERYHFQGVLHDAIALVCTVGWARACPLARPRKIGVATNVKPTVRANDTDLETEHHTRRQASLVSPWHPSYV